MRKSLTRVLFRAGIPRDRACACRGAPPPPGLEPLPEAEPPPPEIANDPELEPQVTIVRRDNVTMEEYRHGGRLVWIKVTPQVGRPYFLIAEGANGAMVRRDSLDSGSGCRCGCCSPSDPANLEAHSRSTGATLRRAGARPLTDVCLHTRLRRQNSPPG